MHSRAHERKQTPMKLKKNGPRLGKRAQAEKAVGETPESPEEFGEYGAGEEESGDKFYGSDPAKALRFYQRAYSAYVQANTNEAAYNALRLLFHVHTRYQGGEIDYRDLTGIEEVLAAEKCVLQDITSIAKAHERVIESNEESDLLFNAAMVYVEILESGDLSVFERGMALLKRVVELQRERLSAGEDVRGEIVETANSSYSLAVAALEAAEGDFLAVQAALGPFVQYMDGIVSSLETADLDMAEYVLGRAYVQAATMQGLEEVLLVWDDAQLPDTPERYMQAADSTESFLLRKVGRDLSVPTLAEGDFVVFWRALSKMTAYLKSAESGLNSRLKEARNGPQALGVGLIIAQLAGVHVARADIDLQRSQLPIEQAQANQELLVRNSKAFLKNAMNLANSSGGIRETVVEKSKRNRRRVEAVFRLCVLEKKTSEEQLDEILGKGRWQEERAVLGDLWYYRLWDN